MARLVTPDNTIIVGQKVLSTAVAYVTAPERAAAGPDRFVVTATGRVELLPGSPTECREVASKCRLFIDQNGKEWRENDLTLRS